MNEYSRKQHAKLTLVIQNFFIKTVQVVNQARILGRVDLTSPTSHDDQKTNKWFNLCLSFSEDAFKEDIRLWKQASSLQDVPPMIVETYLDISGLGPRQALVLYDTNGNPVTVAKGASKKHEVVLERWLVEFDRDVLLGTVVDEVPFIYKQAIILIRNIYTLVRLMPAYKLARKLAKLNGSSSTLLLVWIREDERSSSNGTFVSSSAVVLIIDISLMFTVGISRQSIKDRMKRGMLTQSLSSLTQWPPPKLGGGRSGIKPCLPTLTTKKMWQVTSRGFQTSMLGTRLSG